MTKLEILRNYSDAQIRDTWIAQGSQSANNDTKIYLQDQIYSINVPTSALNGYLIFCSREFRQGVDGILSWDQATLVDYEYGEISFTEGIISPNFVSLLTADEFNAITEPVNNAFIPYAEDYASVIIPDTEFDIIMTDLGAPFITYDELEYSRQTIIDTMIKPALEEYFKWFPKVEIVTYPITTSNVVEHEFPTGAYDVVHVAVNQGIQSGSSNILLRYFDEVVWSAQSPMLGHVGGRKAPRSLQRDWGSMLLDRAVRQGIINYGTRVHHSVVTKHGKKYLRVYSNKQGTLQVHYAMHTLNWNDVEFARRPELRELARANILRAFGALRAQAKADIPGAVDYADWITRAENMANTVREEWKQLVKYSGIIRGSF